jgi:hypothetical protein
LFGHNPSFFAGNDHALGARSRAPRIIRCLVRRNDDDFILGVFGGWPLVLDGSRIDGCRVGRCPEIP